MFGGAHGAPAGRGVPGLLCKWLPGAMWAVAVVAVAFLLGTVRGWVQAAEDARPKKQPAQFTLQANDVAALLKAASREDADLWQPVRRVVLAGGLFGPDDLQAYEEHWLFVYALAARSGDSAAKDTAADAPGTPSWSVSRRVLLVRPSLLVVEDCLRVPGARQLEVPWTVRCPKPTDETDWPARISTAGGDLLWRSVHPVGPPVQSGSHQAGQDGAVLELSAAALERSARFVQAFSLDRSEPGQPPPPGARYTMRAGRDATRLVILIADRQYAVNWPAEPRQPGRIAVREKEEQLLPERLLPAGILPHGPEGMRLMERWDGSYRGRRAGWDVGRPSSELRDAVERGVLRPCRVVELGCGTGTNAIYLAQKGFDVTAIDIAPTALRLAEEKARQAGVSVCWVLANVVRPPRLEPFELVFDRGCYHGVRRQNAAGYVQALKQLTRPGARVLILAGRRISIRAKPTRRGPWPGRSSCGASQQTKPIPK